MTALAWFEHFLRDLRFGVRSLDRSRAITAIAIGSLALGIGGSTAMYSVIYGVILNPFPYKEVDRLVSVQVQGSSRGSNGSYYKVDQFLEIAERNSVFDGTIASTWSDVTWTGDGDPQRLRGNHCTMNTFEVMGVPPLIGRATAASDAVDGAEPVAILGFKFWQRQFGGDAGVLGRKLRLNGKVRTVIGVMPRRFMWRGADVYLPDTIHRGQNLEGEKEVHLLGRLKQGVTMAQAETDLTAIIAELQRRDPNDFPNDWRVRTRTFKETFPSDITNALWILFGAVGLLLLIACVNVSNLLLSKMASRQREIAIRASLGATRLRILSQLLSESLLLGAAGGAIGILAAYGGLRGVLAMVPPGTIPDESEIIINTQVLWFTLAVSIGAALVFGLLPALTASGRDIVSPLKEAGRGLSGNRQQMLLRGGLVVGEVALSVMLLVGASLMIRTLLAMKGGDLGANPDRVLTLRVPFSIDRYPDVNRRVAFLQEALRRIETVPGVVAVGVNTGLPPIGNWTMPVEITGSAQKDGRPVMLHQVNDTYPLAMGVALTSGRFLTEQEVFASVHSAVVNDAFISRHFPGGNAIGRVVTLPRLSKAPMNLANPSFQIVGVTRNVINRIAMQDTIPEIYIPYTLGGAADRVYILSTSRPETLDKAVRQQIYSVDRGQPVTEDKTLEAALGEYVYAGPQFNLFLFAVFASLGLILALSGVYGVISHAVAQRTREIGIRLALGASLRQIVGMVLSAGAKLIAIGVVVGLIGSLASVKVLSGLVRNVSTFDPYSFLAVALLLFAAGLLASIGPARRAGSVDPVIALRE
jgi:putative ABC transport system permease protein